MIRRTLETQRIGRRDLMALFGAGVVAAVGVGVGGRTAKADAKAVSESMMKLIGDKKPAPGKITLEVPQIAENGNTVPISLEVESAMTDSDHVKAVHVWAEKNPRPDVASFMFSPANGKARVSTRIRLRGTQDIIAVAEMSDGSLYMAKSQIKVTIGGCGG